MRPRIFIDFTLVDYRTHVTGIPRVAYAYLEEGYALSRDMRFDVRPVYVRNGALIDASPFLIGSNWRRVRARPAPAAVLQLLRSVAFFVFHGARIMLVTLFVPFLTLLNFLFAYSFFDFWSKYASAGFGFVYGAFRDFVNRVLARRIAVRKGDVLFMAAWWHDTPPGFYKRLRDRGVLICPLVHDILPVTHSTYYTSPWRDQFRSWVFEILRHADHVYYVSAFTRDAVAQVSRRLLAGRRLAPGTVLHHGHDFRRQRSGTRLSSRVREVTAISDPYFLMVGSIEPKKNHLRVLREFERLWRQNESLRLVIVGKGGWDDASIRRTLYSSPYLHSYLTWLEEVSDRELAHLYRHATALIQASKVEGFGLPIIEALSLGTPVLANDIPVFREIGGEYVTYFRADKLGELGERVREVARAGRPTVEAFTWPTWNERARVLYEDLVRRSRAVSTAVTTAPVMEHGRLTQRVRADPRGYAPGHGALADEDTTLQ